MKLNTKKIVKGFTLVELLVVIAIIAALAALATPVVLKQQKKASATTAVNNAKQIFLLLFEYDQEEGNYPTGLTTNEAFQKFFAEGYTSSEEIFYAKTDWSTKPDGDTTASTDVLDAGECGFKYVNGLSAGKSSNLPILGAPFDVVTADTTTFEVELYGGRAVILFNDGSARSLKIDEDGTTGIGPAAGNGQADVFDTVGVDGKILAATAAP